MARRTKLRPDLVKRLTEAIQIGCTYAQACDHAGIATSTFYAWMERGRQGDSEFIEFLEAIKRANAKSVIANLAVVQRAARDGSWQAAAWVLERRHGMTNKPEAPVQINIDASQISIENLLEEVRQTEHLIAEIIADPVIDIDE